MLTEFGNVVKDLILEGTIVLPSPNGRFRIKLQAADDGSLLATVYERDDDDPNRWNTPVGHLSGSKALVQTWHGDDGRLVRIE